MRLPSKTKVEGQSFVSIFHKMAIHFFQESVDFTIDDQQKIFLWLESVARAHKFSIIVLNYIICSDQYMLDINNKYLDHDYYTDIITFDNSDRELEIEGDIFISIDRVRENAKSNNVQITDELNRIIIHGLLHLMGYNDKSADEKKVMSEKENACLSLLSNKVPRET